VSDDQGTLYIGAGDRIRKVTSTGAVTTLPAVPLAPAGARYYPGELGHGRGALVMIDNSPESLGVRLGSPNSLGTVAALAVRADSRQIILPRTRSCNWSNEGRWRERVFTPIEEYQHTSCQPRRQRSGHH
jgi:hypothetical protein